MEFAVVGISYEKASLSIREKAVFTDTKKMEMYVALQGIQIAESVILSTCNRSEIYFLYDACFQIEQVKQLFLAFFDQVDLSDYLEVRVKTDALRYLFEVSNGLHSLVLGEDQIAGQIIKSEEFARDNGQSKKIMNHIFRSVISCTKKAKNKYRISEHPLSLSYVSISLLKKTCGIQGKTAMLLGSGKMSSLALRYLMDHGIAFVYAANRSEENARKLMEEYQMDENCWRLIPFQDRYRYINACDIVVSATSSPHSILKKEKMPVITHDIYMIDMASPRDIALDVHTMEHIHVYDMDVIQSQIDRNTAIRKEKAIAIHTLIDEEVEKCENWINSVVVDHTIQTLQERIEEVSQEAYCLLERKLTLSEHEKYILKKTLKTSMQRLMHDPIKTLKEERDIKKQQQYQMAVEELFHLENE